MKKSETLIFMGSIIVASSLIFYYWRRGKGKSKYEKK